jgi:hypothetical protein
MSHDIRREVRQAHGSPGVAGLCRRRACVAVVVAGVLAGAAGSIASSADAAVSSEGAAAGERVQSGGRSGSALEAAATRASATGRTVAMSLIGLAFAIAATVLAFRRDFKEAAGVFAVGIVSVLLATPAGVNLLRDTVSTLFGA